MSIDTRQAAQEAMPLLLPILDRFTGHERGDFINDLYHHLEEHYYHTTFVSSPVEIGDEPTLDEIVENERKQFPDSFDAQGNYTEPCPECDVVGGNDACYYCHPS